MVSSFQLLLAVFRSITRRFVAFSEESKSPDRAEKFKNLMDLVIPTVQSSVENNGDN